MKQQMSQANATSTEMRKTILASDELADGLAGLIQAGPLLFTAGCDGHRDLGTAKINPELAGNPEAQCENAYGRVGALLRRANADFPSVVRLDHATSSQDWLPRRQAIRGKLFGRPAPLASTGVGAKMSGINMLTTFVIAVADPADKEVLIPGARYGMNNISSAVRGGPFLFLAGIRGTLDPRTGRTVSEETHDAFPAQLRMSYDIINAILAEIGADASAILRLDCYIRDITRSDEDSRVRDDVLGSVACASTVVGLPLSARGEVEITTIALAPGHAKQVVAQRTNGLPCVVRAGGFLFIGECRGNVTVETGELDRSVTGDRRGQLLRALDVLDTRLRNAGSNSAQVVRLELYLRDIYFAEQANAVLRQHFGNNPPVVSTTGAELDDLVEVKLNAIAI